MCEMRPGEQAIGGDQLQRRWGFIVRRTETGRVNGSAACAWPDYMQPKQRRPTPVWCCRPADCMVSATTAAGASTTAWLHACWAPAEREGERAVERGESRSDLGRRDGRASAEVIRGLGTRSRCSTSARAFRLSAHVSPSLVAVSINTRRRHDLHLPPMLAILPSCGLATDARSVMSCKDGLAMAILCCIFCRRSKHRE